MNTTPSPDRPGTKVVVLSGRGYPSARAAITKLREALERDGIKVDDADIWARRWTSEPVICPWEAAARIPENHQT